jgi:hypothetical protein
MPSLKSVCAETVLDNEKDEDEEQDANNINKDASRHIRNVVTGKVLPRLYLRQLQAVREKGR